MGNNPYRADMVLWMDRIRRRMVVVVMKGEIKEKMLMREADRIAKETIEEYGYTVEEWEKGEVPEEEIEEIRKTIDFSISACIIGVFPAPRGDDIDGN